MWSSGSPEEIMQSSGSEKLGHTSLGLTDHREESKLKVTHGRQQQKVQTIAHTAIINSQEDVHKMKTKHHTSCYTPSIAAKVNSTSTQHQNSKTNIQNIKIYPIPEVTGSTSSATIFIGKHKIRSVFDTGSMISCIQSDIYKKLPKTHKSKLSETTIQAVSVTQKPVNILGKTNIKFKLGKHEIVHPFYVIADLKPSAILGTKFFKQHNISLHYGSNNDNNTCDYIEFKNQKIPLQNEAYMSSLVRLNQTVRLPPQTTAVANIKIQNQKRVNTGKTTYMIQGIDTNFMGLEPYLEILNTVSKVNKNKPFPLAICNMTNRHFTLKKGSVIASATQIEPEQIQQLNIQHMQNNTNLHKSEHNNEQRKPETPSETSNINAKIGTPEQIAQIKDLIEKNSDIFAESDRVIGHSDVKHNAALSINTGDHPPIQLKPYRYPLSTKHIIDKHVDNYIENKIIETSQAPWAFPVVIVKKKDGSTRFCVDYRKLNACTSKWVYPMPTLSDCLEKLSGSKYFAKLDMRSGYHHIPLQTEEDKDKTTFATHRGLFRFLRCPFGLVNAPSIFNYLLQNVFKDVSCIVVYMDDLLVFSSSFKEHLKNLELTFSVLRKNGLYLKMSKCEFLETQVPYLGHMISAEGVSVDPDKIKVIKEMKSPSCVKEVRSFLGATGYYRNFIDHYSVIAEPLTFLTRKNAKFEWSEECQKAFDHLKQCLITPPVLALPDVNKPYKLYCDASKSCIGALLAQDDEHGYEKPIQYVSHQLSKTQQRWSVIEKECFSIVYALGRLRHYLLDAQIDIFTDHKPLKYLLTSEMKNVKIQKWAIEISQYNCNIHYVSGSLNTRGDFLSRLRHETPETELGNDVHNEVNIIGSIKTNVLGIFDKQNDPHNDHKIPTEHSEAEANTEKKKADKKQTYDVHKDTFKEVPDNLDMADEQRKDPELIKLITKLEKNSKHLTHHEKNYTLIDSILYYIKDTDDNPTKLVIPMSLQDVVVDAYHGPGSHLRVDKTFDTIKDKYYFKGLYRKVVEKLDKCQECQTRDSRHKPQPLQPVKEALFPWHIVGIDTCGPFPTSHSGNSYVVNLVCQFTGYPECFPCPDKSAETIAQIFLDHVYPVHFSPVYLVSDRGKEYVSTILDHICKVLKIARIKTSPYHAQSNSTTERFHRYMNDAISKEVGTATNIRNWDKVIPSLLAAYRSSCHLSKKFSPFYLMHGRDPCLPLDTLLQPRRKYVGDEYHKIQLQNLHKAYMTVAKNTSKARHKNQELFDRKAQKVEFQVGDPVFYWNFTKSSKLEQNWLPHFRILSKSSPVNFKIKHQISQKVYDVHANNLKLANLEWNIPKPKENLRSTQYVVSPPASSDSELSDHVSTFSDTDEFDSEDERPLAELQSKLRHEQSPTHRMTLRPRKTTSINNMRSTSNVQSILRNIAELLDPSD